MEKGYENCINLLVKYKLTIDSIKTYSDITKVPFSEKRKGYGLNIIYKNILYLI